MTCCHPTIRMLLCPCWSAPQLLLDTLQQLLLQLIMKLLLLQLLHLYLRLQPLLLLNQLNLMLGL